MNEDPKSAAELQRDTTAEWIAKKFATPQDPLGDGSMRRPDESRRQFEANNPACPDCGTRTNDHRKGCNEVGTSDDSFQAQPQDPLMSDEHTKGRATISIEFTDLGAASAAYDKIEALLAVDGSCAFLSMRTHLANDTSSRVTLQNRKDHGK